MRIVLQIVRITHCLIKYTDRIIFTKVKSYYDYRFLLKNGVEVKRGTVTLLGRPIIQRHPKSRIIIEEGVTLISNSKFNVAGINHPVILATCAEGAIITLKKNCGLSGTSIVSVQRIEIGENVNIGVNSNVYDTDFHPISFLERRKNPGFDLEKIPYEEVIISHDVWIGANTTILKGVKIGAASIIGANSLVIKTIGEMELHAGVPSKFIKNLID